MVPRWQGVADVLCEACEEMKWTQPTVIQREALPVALQGELFLKKSDQLAITHTKVSSLSLCSKYHHPKTGYS